MGRKSHTWAPLSIRISLIFFLNESSGSSTFSFSLESFNFCPLAVKTQENKEVFFQLRIFYVYSISQCLRYVSIPVVSKSRPSTLKVPKCEIFDPFFFTPINPIWVGDLRTGEKKIFFGRLRQIFAILFFLRRLSLR